MDSNNVYIAKEIEKEKENVSNTNSSCIKRSKNEDCGKESGRECHSRNQDMNDKYRKIDEMVKYFAKQYYNKRVALIESDIKDLREKLREIEKQNNQFHSIICDLERKNYQFLSKIYDLERKNDLILERINSATGVYRESYMIKGGNQVNSKLGRNQIEQSVIEELNQIYCKIDVIAGKYYREIGGREYYKHLANLYSIISSMSSSNNQIDDSIKNNESRFLENEQNKQDIEKITTAYMNWEKKIDFSRIDYPKYELVFPYNGDHFCDHKYDFIETKDIHGRNYCVDFCIFPGIIETSIDNYTLETTEIVRLKAKVWLKES